MSTSPVDALWFMRNFAQRLKELRSARNLSQTRLAELLEISPRVYSRWETGDVTPQFDELAGRKDVKHSRVSRVMSEL